MVISLVRELFAKDIYITNVCFKSILEPYNCQIAKYFWGFAANPIGDLQSRSPNLPAPKLRNSQFVYNGPSRKFLAHTLVKIVKIVLFFVVSKLISLFCKEMNLKIEPPPHKQILWNYPNKTLGQWEEFFQIKL